MDNELPATKVKPLGSVIAGLGGLKPTSALIDHEAPAGLSLDPEFIPWPAFGRMGDDGLEAIRRYIGSLPAAASPSGG